jgi:hypothetical protein
MGFLAAARRVDASERATRDPVQPSNRALQLIIG